MIWAVMGVGMLVNAIQGNAQAAQQREMNQAQQAESARMMKQMQQQQVAMNENPFQNLLDIQTGLPDYPEENFANLQEMQLGHADARQAFTDELGADLQSAKVAFYDENHLETKVAEDGSHEVALGPDGKPVPKFGGENSDQKMARLTLEGKQKSETADKHSAQKDQFLAKEKENFKEFLAQNREQLNNPYVHGELQRMVVNTKKKSLDLQQNQEDERWRLDAPPDDSIGAKLDAKLADLHDMDRRHLEAEEQSPDAQALMEHDQKVAAILDGHKQKARDEEADEDYMMDPRKMMAAASNRSKPKDLGQQLPAYLSNAMYEMGIYEA